MSSHDTSALGIDVSRVSSSTETRERVYAWLAAAFYLPDKEVASPQFIAQGCALWDLIDVRADDKRSSASGWALQAAINDGLDGVALSREYARLFLGPQRALVRPYESCYFGDGLLMSERAVLVRRFYRDCGYEVDTQPEPEAPEHIAVQLTFLSSLCERQRGVSAHEVVASEGARVARVMESRFLSEHLGRWGAQFADSVLQHSAHPLYCGAALILHHVLWRAHVDDPASHSEI